MAAMAVAPADRPLETLREETIDRLIMNYGHGQLALEAFQRRLDQALDATGHDVLRSLVADLDLEVDARFVAQKRGELRAPEPPTDEGEVDYFVNIFSGSRRTGRWTAPADVRVITLFGGGEIDFTDAVFASPTTRVRLLCLFGGVTIFVPQEVNATVSAFAIFGGIDNRAPTSSDPNAPRIIVDGFVMFGGADVKIKKSLRKRALELATELRTWFDGGRP